MVLGSRATLRRSSLRHRGRPPGPDIGGSFEAGSVNTMIYIVMNITMDVKGRSVRGERSCAYPCSPVEPRRPHGLVHFRQLADRELDEAWPTVVKDALRAFKHLTPPVVETSTEILGIDHGGCRHRGPGRLHPSSRLTTFAKLDAIHSSPEEWRLNPKPPVLSAVLTRTKRKERAHVRRITPTEARFS